MKYLLQYLLTYNFFLFFGTALRYFTQSADAEQLSYFEVMQTVWLRYFVIAAIYMVLMYFFRKNKQSKTQE